MPEATLVMIMEATEVPFPLTGMQVTLWTSMFQMFPLRQHLMSVTGQRTGPGSHSSLITKAVMEAGEVGMKQIVDPRKDDTMKLKGLNLVNFRLTWQLPSK